MSDRIIICPNCGYENENSRFCVKCGNLLDRVEEPKRIKICPNCGNEIEEGNKFCTICGYQMEHEPEIKTVIHDPEPPVKSNREKYIIIALSVALAVVAIMFFTKKSPTPDPGESSASSQVETSETPAQEFYYYADVYDSLAVHSSPDVNASIIATVPPYGRMRYITSSGYMYQIRVDSTGVVGWVDSNFLVDDTANCVRAGRQTSQTEETPTQEIYYYADVYDNLSVRSAANTSASVIARVPPFGKLLYISRLGKMYKVKVVNTGVIGWVNSEYLASNTNYCVRAGKRKPSTSKSSSRKSSSRKSSTTRYSTGSSFYIVATSPANIRRSPYTSSTKITDVDAGRVMRCTGETAIDSRGVRWYHVSFQGRTKYINGWISGKMVRRL